MTRSRVLLVNPPIHDFTAYDFWLRPYGMLRVAGRIQHACDLDVFDFLVARASDPWGRGRFPEQLIARPPAIHDIPSRFRRFGRPRAEFCEFLYVLIGHPDCELDEVEATMRFAHDQGVRIQLSEFSPVPGTRDGERCRQ